MATIGKVAQGADDLIRSMMQASQGKLQPVAESLFSATTRTGTANLVTNKLLTRATLQLNNGDTFVRTVTQNGFADDIMLAGEKILEGTSGKSAESIWKIFLDTIFNKH